MSLDYHRPYKPTKEMFPERDPLVVEYQVDIH